MLVLFFQKPEIMANKHGAAGNEEEDESDEDTSVSLYMIIIYLGATMFDLFTFTRYYHSIPPIIFQDEEREDLMDDFEAQLERENRIRELKAKKRKLSKSS